MAMGKMSVGYKAPRYRRRKNRLYKTKRAPDPGITSLTLKKGYGLPDRYTSVLRFRQFVKLDTAGSGSLAGKVFRGNSLFDPDVSTGGFQPLYRDQLAAIYNHYMVWGSKITVEIVSTENGTGGNAEANTVAVFPSRQFTVPTNITNALEQPRCRYKVFRDGSDNTYKIVNSARTKQMLITDSKGWNSTVVAEEGSNPQDGWYWQIVAQALQGAAGEAVVECNVIIDYLCTWYERKQVGSS